MILEKIFLNYDELRMNIRKHMIKILLFGECMNSEIDKSVWEAYNDFKLDTGSDREKFKEGIRCFSSYLCHANPDYAYNTTYLPQFNEDFLFFIDAFHRKYRFVRDFFDIAKEYSDVTLKIDRYWMLETKTEERWKESTLNGRDFVCEKELMIECSVLYDLKRYVYQRSIMIPNKEFENLKNDFENFLKKYSSKTEKTEKL